ncbi:hypothetical protein B0T19DRAFT_478765 [Cercophora scortea]|uniref:RNase H type-1 domain-containing protein n=1 Tax=Cercophora scortea TaxID=314031 RepID=A0AAE0I6V2_9PEZI|nr:hypothetical protein B0T19DRAFT_478765 [Cercophora scortea]
MEGHEKRSLEDEDNLVPKLAKRINAGGEPSATAVPVAVNGDNGIESRVMITMPDDEARSDQAPSSLHVAEPGSITNPYVVEPDSPASSPPPATSIANDGTHSTKTATSSPPPDVFCGQVHITEQGRSGSSLKKQMRNRARDKAVQHESIISTTKKVILVAYVDGSAKDENGVVSWAVVWRRFAPGHPDDGKVIGMAWHAAGVCSNVAESLAMLQGVEILTRELERAAVLARRNYWDEIGGRNREAKIVLFSDSMAVLETVNRLTKEDHNVPNHGKGYLARRIAQSSQRLLDNEAGLSIDLSLYWVPGHCNQCRHHQLADQLSRRARENCTNLSIVEEAPNVNKQGAFIKGIYEHEYRKMRTAIYNGPKNISASVGARGRNGVPFHASAHENPPRIPTLPPSLEDENRDNESLRYVRRLLSTDLDAEEAVHVGATADSEATQLVVFQKAFKRGAEDNLENESNAKRPRIQYPRTFINDGKTTFFRYELD